MPSDFMQDVKSGKPPACVFAPTIFIQKMISLESAEIGLARRPLLHKAEENPHTKVRSAQLGSGCRGTSRPPRPGWWHSILT